MDNRRSQAGHTAGTMHRRGVLGIRRILLEKHELMRVPSKYTPCPRERKSTNATNQPGHNNATGNIPEARLLNRRVLAQASRLKLPDRLPAITSMPIFLPYPRRGGSVESALVGGVVASALTEDVVVDVAMPKLSFQSSSQGRRPAEANNISISFWTIPSREDSPTTSMITKRTSANSIPPMIKITKGLRGTRGMSMRLRPPQQERIRVFCFASDGA